MRVEWRVPATVESVLCIWDMGSPRLAEESSGEATRFAIVIAYGGEIQSVESERRSSPLCSPGRWSEFSAKGVVVEFDFRNPMLGVGLRAGVGAVITE